MAAFSMDLQGVKAAQKALEGLPMFIRDEALDAGYQEAGEVVRSAIVDRAPVKTGNLRRSISRFRKVVGGEKVLDVRPSYKKGKGGSHAHLVEYGTRPHSLARKKKGAAAAADGPQHPGAAPHPYFEPGVTAASGPALEVLKASLSPAADRYWASRAVAA